MLNITLIVISVLSGFLLILFILLHAGRGGGLSDMFGGGGASMSGGTSVERSLDRVTVVTALVFVGATFWLALRWT